MRDEAFGVAEIVRDAHEPERVLKAECAFLAACDLERDECRTAAHLLFHNGSLRVIVASWIDRARDFWMRGESVRDGGGSFGLACDAHAQGLEPFENDPRIERRNGRPNLADQHLHVVRDELLRTEHHTAKTAALAVDVLRRRIDHAVRAEFEWGLIERRR